MNTTRTITKLSLGAIAGVAMFATQLPGGIAHATSIGVGELQECTISKSMDTASIGAGDLADWQSNYGVGASSETGDGDVDGRDFLVWQRG